MRNKDTPYWLSGYKGGIYIKGPTDIIFNASFINGSHRNSDGSLFIPSSRENILALESLGIPDWVSPEYLQYRAAIMRPTEDELTQWNNLTGEFMRPLLSHQIEFCARGVNYRGLFNGCDPGLGKTATAWAIAKATKPRRMLILCPKSMMGEWANEQRLILKPNDRIPCVALSGDEPVAEKEMEVNAYTSMVNEDICIVANYELARLMKQAFLRFAPNMLICDESWKVKSPNAQVTNDVIEIADKAQRVLLLSGSMIGNDIGDLWSQIRIMYGPSFPMTYAQFIQRFARIETYPVTYGIKQKLVGCSDPVGVMQLLSPVYYRATKSTCLNLPPTQHIFPVLELRPAIRELYKKIVNDGEAALDSGSGLSLAGEGVTKIRLQQLAGGFLYSPIQQTSTFVGSPKMDYVEEFARDVLTPYPSTRCIIWCKFNNEVFEIAKRLHDILEDKIEGRHAAVASITGKSSVERIEGIKASFNSRHPQGVQVIVAQIKKLCSGHNLQSADENIFYSHTWSYIEYDQALNRAHRIGREGAVNYRHLNVRGTEDTNVWDCLENKRDFANEMTPHTYSGDEL